MVIQNQSEMGEGSTMPTDPHHTPTILQPSSSQPQKTQKTRKPKTMDTQVPQPSDSTDNVADEAIHKELVDSLVRVVTTVSSLEAEQDSGNINKTQSKATPNEPSSQRTDSGGGPRCQETIGDTTAQTRFESVSKHSNDSLLVRGNTLQSDEDSLKLTELMALCTNLQSRVLDLEKTKTTQRNETDSLKRMVKKLEKRNRSRTHKLKRLDNVGLSARVESFRDEELLGGKEMFVAEQNESVVEEIVDVAQTCKRERERAEKEQEANISLIETWNDIQAKINVDHQLAERLQAQGQDELSDAENATLFQQLLEKRKKHFAAKKAEEKRNKLPTQALQRKILVNTFEDFRTKLVKGKEKREGEELEQEITKKKKVEDNKEKAKLKQLMKTILDKEQVEIDAIPLAVKSPRIVDWKIHKEGKKSYYQIIYMLVEKKYPLTPPTLTMMLEKKLQIDYESEMAYQLCKLINKQLKK
nr:hypothetical protein [Tanacetum cinerariifolium]